MMKRDYLKEKKEWVATVLVVVSVISAVLIGIKVTDFFVTSAKAEGAVKQAIEQGKPDAENVAAQLGRCKQVADALKKSNLFAPPPPKENPVKVVMGIFGDEALINGKWYREGAKVGDAKIVSIGPVSVITEWDGKQKTFTPIDNASAGPSTPSRPAKKTSSSRSTSSSSRMVVAGKTVVRRGGDELVTRDTFAQLGAGLGVNLPSRVQDGLMKYWSGLSDKEKAQSRERWERMSDKERKQTLEGAKREMR
jgi:hypothetical protein